MSDDEILDLDEVGGGERYSVALVADPGPVLTLLQQATSTGGFGLTVVGHKEAVDDFATVDVLVVECRLVEAFVDLADVRRWRAKYPMLPILVMAGNPDKDFIIEAFKAGATDYYLSDEDPVVVGRRLVSVAKLGTAGRLVEVQNQELLKHMADLRREMAERKRVELERQETREQLAEAAKNATLGEVAGSIAHEINTPLGVIVGSADMLHDMLKEESPDLETSRMTAEEIVKMAERISAIIRGLKTFSRQGEADPFESIAAKDLVEETLALCSEQLERHGLDIQVAVPDDLVVDCQPTQITQVLLNLLGNARHATEGSEEKWVKLEVRADGDDIVFAVSDSGTGIEDDIAEKVLEPYFTTKPKGIGTGLGLSISNRIINAHDGDFRLASRRDPTRFEAKFPRQCRPEKKQPADKAS